MSNPTRPLKTRRAALLAVGAIGVGVFLSYRILGTPDYQGAALSVDDAYRLANSGEIFLIDIRRPDEWERTGIGEGAIPIDMRRRDFVDALQEISGLDKTKAIALICAGGVRSARLGTKLSQAGFADISDVPEGMLGSRAGPGWVRRGLPVIPYKDQST